MIFLVVEVVVCDVPFDLVAVAEKPLVVVTIDLVVDVVVYDVLLVVVGSPGVVIAVDFESSVVVVVGSSVVVIFVAIGIGKDVKSWADVVLLNVTPPINASL